MLEKLCQIYEAKGISASYDNNTITLSYDDGFIKVEIEEEWILALNNYFKITHNNFNSEKRILINRKSIEFQLVGLRVEAINKYFSFNYTEDNGDKIEISKDSKSFAIALLASQDELKYFDYLKRKIARNKGMTKKFETIIYIPYTAKYTLKRVNKTIDLTDVGRKRIKATLFALTELNETVFELKENFTYQPYMNFDEEVGTLENIPNTKYQDELVYFYKVAVSSRYASQAFLSYYHVLEYNFDIVSEDILYNQIRIVINQPNFNTNNENIRKLVGVMKKHDLHQQENDKLKNVLNKYIDKDSLIEFIKEVELKVGQKVYTSDQIIFGEKKKINIKESDHVIANVAAVIKKIRNGLVHSTDNYEGGDCFIPFSKSEEVVQQFLPLIKFLARQVICATAI